MTDKELIKEEIERRIKEISDACDGVIMVETISVEYNTLCNIRDYINSLPEENHFEDKSEMVSEDLEEEIDRYYSDWQFDDDTIYEDMRDICRHFAEWQKQKDQETIELAEDHAMLAGMMKEREEMMKDAVDAIVHQGLYSKYVKECDDEALANALKNYNSGDKVKIIIVKED